MSPTPPSSEPRPTPVNWAAVRARVNAAMGEATEDTAQRAARDRDLLERRARVVAEPIADTPTAVPDHEVIVFALGTQAFALPAATVREVLAPRHITPLPGVAAHVRGLTNVRSRVVPVFDLRPILELPAIDEPEAQRLVLLGSNGAEFAVLTDQVIGAREIAAGATRRQVAGLDAQFVQSVTSDGLILLDVEPLIRALTLEDSPSR